MVKTDQQWSVLALLIAIYPVQIVMADNQSSPQMFTLRNHNNAKPAFRPI